MLLLSHLTLHRCAEALGTRAEKAFRRSSEVIWAMMALFATSPQSGAVETCGNMGSVL